MVKQARTGRGTNAESEQQPGHRLPARCVFTLSQRAPGTAGRTKWSHRCLPPITGRAAVETRNTDGQSPDAALLSRVSGSDTELRRSCSRFSHKARESRRRPRSASRPHQAPGTGRGLPPSLGQMKGSWQVPTGQLQSHLKCWENIIS